MRTFLFVMFILTNIVTSNAQNCSVGGIYIDAYLLDPNFTQNGATVGFDTDGSGTVENNDEFVQICNSSASTVDLSTYSISEISGSTSESYTLSGNVDPGMCVVIISNYNTTGTVPSNFISLGISTSIFNNGGETISITDGTTTCSQTISEAQDGIVSVNNSPDPIQDENISPSDLGQMPLSNQTSPVSFTKVMGEYKNKETEISWSTASEINNAYFEVEKSIDGKEYTAIGTVKGAGNSTSERHYTFIDQQPDPIAYYRVKQVDYDGRSSHSSIVLVRGDTSEAIHLRNTIVDDYLYIENTQQTTIQIFNQNGQGRYEAVLQNGSNTIDMEQFNAGIYFVAINDGQRVYTSRIVKR